MRATGASMSSVIALMPSPGVAFARPSRAGASRPERTGRPARCQGVGGPALGATGPRDWPRATLSASPRDRGERGARDAEPRGQRAADEDRTGYRDGRPAPRVLDAGGRIQRAAPGGTGQARPAAGRAVDRVP